MQEPVRPHRVRLDRTQPHMPPHWPFDPRVLCSPPGPEVLTGQRRWWPWRWGGRGARGTGWTGPPSTRGSPCWWSLGTTAPARRNVRRRARRRASGARTWHRHRTKRSPGAHTLQQVDRCPVVFVCFDEQLTLNFKIPSVAFTSPPPPLLPPFR